MTFTLKDYKIIAKCLESAVENYDNKLTGS